MLEGFEKFTERLTEEERKVIPTMLRFLSFAKRGGEKTNKDISAHIEKMLHITLHPAKVRKVINYIRLHNMICLAANGKGYYVCKETEDKKRYARSLVERATAIQSVAVAFMECAEITEEEIYE